MIQDKSSVKKNVKILYNLTALQPYRSLNCVEGMENGLAATERYDHAFGRIELVAVDSSPVANFTYEALQNTRVFHGSKSIKNSLMSSANRRKSHSMA